MISVKSLGIEGDKRYDSQSWVRRIHAVEKKRKKGGKIKSKIDGTINFPVKKQHGLTGFIMSCKRVRKTRRSIPEQEQNTKGKEVEELILFKFKKRYGKINQNPMFRGQTS